MSIATQLLVVNSALLAVVPSIRIMAGVVPVTTAAPAISLMQINGEERKTVSMAEPTRYKTDRVQITIRPGAATGAGPAVTPGKAAPDTAKPPVPAPAPVPAPPAPAPQP